MMFLPGGIVGGAPILAASVGWVTRGSTALGTSKTISSVSFGDVLLGRNQRWILVCIQHNDSGTPATVSSPAIGGVSATILSNAQTPLVASLRARFTWFAALVPTGTSGDITYTSSNSDGNQYQVFRLVNISGATLSDSDTNAAAALATLSIDCPAGGAIIGSGYYAYSGGSTPTSADFANLTTLDFVDANIGYTASGSVFASAQTGLSVTYDPTPNTNLTRSHASAISLPYAL